MSSLLENIHALLVKNSFRSPLCSHYKCTNTNTHTIHVLMWSLYHLQTGTFAVSLVQTHVNRVWKPNIHLNLQNHLQKQTGCTENQINCMKRCGHTQTHKHSVSLSLTHTHTHLSEHEWRRQSVHTGSSWSWMCQSQQLNTSLDMKVSN